MRRRLAVLPVAATAATVALTAGSAPAAKAPPCDVDSEHLTYFPDGGGAAGTLHERFKIRHRGRGGRCSLKGYPKVTLLGKRRKVVPVKVRRDRSRKVRRRVLAKGHPVWFEIAHPSMDPDTGRPCSRRVYRFRVLFPGHSRALTVKGFDPVRFCTKRARVSPFMRRL